MRGQRKGKLLCQPAHSQPDCIFGKRTSIMFKEHGIFQRIGAGVHIQPQDTGRERTKGNKAVFSAFTMNENPGIIKGHIVHQQSGNLTLSQTGIKHKGDERIVPQVKPVDRAGDRSKDLFDLGIRINQRVCFGRFRNLNVIRGKGQQALTVGIVQKNAYIPDVSSNRSP